MRQSPWGPERPLKQQEEHKQEDTMGRKAKHGTIIVTATLLNSKGVASREHMVCSPMPCRVVAPH